MIIKNLSRKNADGSGQLVKYIFKYIFRDQGVKTKKNFDRPLYIPKSVRVSQKDLKFLHAEQIDKNLLDDFKKKYPYYDYKSYIQNYLMSKGTREDKEINNTVPGQVAPFVIKYNMKGANTINGFIRQFEKVEKGRIHKRADQTSVHHTIISWSNMDSHLINEKMLRDMSKEYIRLMGVENVYAGTVHTDKSHIHLHIAMSGTTIDGKSSRISKKEFEDVKIKLQEYQIQHYPELVHSLPSHGKAKKEKEKEAVQKIYRTERNSSKESIMKCLETTYPLAKSTQDFVSLLSQNGYAVYERNGVLTGIEHGGYKYRFSRLGIDLKSLKQLDEKRVKEEVGLKEIHELRTRNNRVRSIPFEERTAGMDDSKQRTEQQELLNNQRAFEGKNHAVDTSPSVSSDQQHLMELREIRGKEILVRDDHEDAAKDRTDDLDQPNRDEEQDDDTNDNDPDDDKISEHDTDSSDDDDDQQP